MTGSKFGRLTVIGSAGLNRFNQLRWHCKCDCGNEITSLGMSLRRGETKSCGCLRREKSADALKNNKLSLRHGDTSNYRVTPEYRCWLNMRMRCYKPVHVAFKHYGGRGIQVCARWFTFENFLADMGRKPSRKHSIDRINTDGHYMPSNCRWATQSEQMFNRRASVEA